MRWLIITLGVLIAVSSFFTYSSADEIGLCKRRCKAQTFNLDQCVKDENYWEDQTIRQARIDCRFLIYQEKKDCMDECEPQNQETINDQSFVLR